MSRDRISKKTSELQNRFTSYLVSAVINRKYHFLKKRANYWERESDFYNMEDQNISNFEDEFANYISEQLADLCENILQIQELLELIDNSHLLKAIRKLSEREQKILFARVFRQCSFEEIGQSLQMTGKQAEASYHYCISKLRKEVEGK